MGSEQAEHHHEQQCDAAGNCGLGNQNTFCIARDLGKLLKRASIIEISSRGSSSAIKFKVENRRSPVCRYSVHQTGSQVAGPAIGSENRSGDRQRSASTHA